MEERRERWQRTNVAVLDFSPTGGLESKNASTVDELKMHLHNKPDGTSTRFIIVEDLSNDVIELLGGKFDIDPAFFREHINDYSWYNIRDRWMYPQNLDSAQHEQNWTRVRFARPRYFRTNDSFQEAREEANRFNVFRRPDDDQNQWPILEGEAIVAITRTRTLLWLNTDFGDAHETIGMFTLFQPLRDAISTKSNISPAHADCTTLGIILVDPTVKQGYPLWHGYRNWTHTPSMHSQAPVVGPPRTSLFEDLIYWTSTYPWFQPPGKDSKEPLKAKDILTQPTLHIACGEWNIMCELIKTRLGQIEWELGFPEQFGSNMNQKLINQSVRRLHAWRRLIPVYREMLSETINESARLQSNLTPQDVAASHNTQDIPGFWSGPQQSSTNNIIADFKRVLNQMNELQGRTDRITSVLMAAISIEDSRHVAGLTWLATVFIPLSFIAGLFSMQPDITTLSYTFGWYFAAAVPLTAIALVLATNIKILQPLQLRLK